MHDINNPPRTEADRLAALTSELDPENVMPKPTTAQIEDANEAMRQANPNFDGDPAHMLYAAKGDVLAEQLVQKVNDMTKSAEATAGTFADFSRTVERLNLAEQSVGIPAIDKAPAPTVAVGIDPSGEEPGTAVIDNTPRSSDHAKWGIDEEEFRHETHDQHLQRLRDGVNKLVTEEERVKVDPVADHIGRTKVGTIAHVSPGRMGRAALSAVLAQTLLGAGTSAEALLHQQRQAGLKARLKDLFVVKGDSKEIKRRLRRLKDKNFGPIMDVKLGLPANTMPGQKGPGSVDGHVLLNWVYRTNEYRDLGNLSRILGLNSTGMYGRPWTFEFAADLTSEVVWMLVLLVPGMVKTDDEMTPDHKLDCIELAVDGVERALTGRVAV